ncbi:MBL fold metallo-hydrolase [Pontibacter vulgaris]|uniref:MBL fold metallo-hydrolase n=1 Tax=Pontibacter vulgaris TaxID=2905679 RepID=UPI001FA7A110|nr:MBL fold metallo-hydrolase [Pontibacter vulgaris]
MPEHTHGPLRLQFVGAAGVVTGSQTLLQTGKYNILIDCGLFQGTKKERKLNRVNRLPYKPSELDAIILTHGHLDHSGYLPVLVKKGYTGPIYATAPTRDITEIILCDSAKIQEADTRDYNQYRDPTKRPLKPLYREKHVNMTMKLFKAHEDDEWVSIADDLKFRFQKSGHILGSATVELECQGRRFVFSGDVGQRDPLILDPPARIKEADYIIMESTYGDKLHNNDTSPYQALQDVVNKTFEKGGSLVIPSFAVERAQEIIMLLNNLMDEKSIPKLPIYFDSPMGIGITKLFQEHNNWHNMTDSETNKLTDNVHIIESFEETLTVLDDNGPKSKIIIAGSGMATGGRVLHYLKEMLYDAKNTVLLVGHQSKGTRGYQLLHNAEAIGIEGKNYRVNAEICQIGSLSAHGDQADLLWWLGRFKENPKQIFLNHGEGDAAHKLKDKIEEKYSWPVTVAELNKVYGL